MSAVKLLAVAIVVFNGNIGHLYTLLQSKLSKLACTYPTVRLRLDRLIQKIHISEDTNNEPYIALIKRLAVNEKIDFDTAKILMSEYKKIKKEAE